MAHRLNRIFTALENPASDPVPVVAPKAARQVKPDKAKPARPSKPKAARKK